jgi:hypothetical protein
MQWRDKRLRVFKMPGLDFRAPSHFGAADLCDKVQFIYFNGYHARPIFIFVARSVCLLSQYYAY